MEKTVLFYQKEEDKRQLWQSLRSRRAKLKSLHSLDRHENHTSLLPEYTLTPKLQGAFRPKSKNIYVGKNPFCIE